MSNNFSIIYEFIKKEMSILIFLFNLTDINGHETGSNKQTASKSCALSIVRQLYHLGVIEAFNGTLKKVKDAEQMKAYPVKISGELQNEIYELLTALEIHPVDVKKPLVNLKNNNFI